TISLVLISFKLFDQVKREKMASKDDLNYVAYHIIEILEEQGLDNSYINEKIDRLYEFGENKAATLLWASNQLDSRNFRLLLGKLNLTPDQVKIFCRVLNKLKKYLGYNLLS
ncbi:hypothetical protein, partial [Acinetobacter baumannii]